MTAEYAKISILIIAKIPLLVNITVFTNIGQRGNTKKNISLKFCYVKNPVSEQYIVRQRELRGF